MTVRALAYIVISAARSDEWTRFASEVLGAQVVDHQSGAKVRLDDRAARLFVTPGSNDDLDVVAWELPSVAELTRLVRGLEEGGSRVKALDADTCAARGVMAGCWTTDPDGLRLEFVVAPAVDVQPFVSGTSTRFVTGELGLGHVVLYSSDLDASQSFYRDQLGFRVTDSVTLSTTRVVFMRCNARHHSLALVSGRASRHLQHFMVEVADLRMVGEAFDRCDILGQAQSSIGQHSNDHMVSFYAQPPGSDYTIEYGYGGRVVDEAIVPVTYSSTSWWGHKDLLPGQL